jgi:hypothetical protein
MNANDVSGVHGLRADGEAVDDTTRYAEVKCAVRSASPEGLLRVGLPAFGTTSLLSLQSESVYAYEC